METLYNCQGEAIAYLNDDNVHIYMYDGTPVAYLHDDSIYNFSGRYLGWIYSGMYYDRNGFPTFFTENSSGGPSKPSKQSKPSRSSRQSLPSKSSRESRPSKPSRSLSWSPYTGLDYFINQ